LLCAVVECDALLQKKRSGTTMFSKVICAAVVAIAVGQGTTNFEKSQIQNVDMFELKDGVLATNDKAELLNVRDCFMIEAPFFCEQKTLSWPRCCQIFVSMHVRRPLFNSHAHSQERAWAMRQDACSVHSLSACAQNIPTN
jgi:hypothetical protein